MTTAAQWDNLIGSTAIDADGEKVGKVGQVYLNDVTGQPEWVTVSTGLFGMRESLAPLYDAQPGPAELRLAVTKQQVLDAPNLDASDHLAESEIDALYRHYAGYAGPGVAGVAGVAGVQGRDVSGPTTDDAMTRSEERLHIGTETVPAGRVRLRKYVVTENVTRTVPVSHEEVRLEREPITEANAGAAMSGPDISEEEHEVTLHAERPVVEKEAVPVERVRLGTETVTEQHQVSEQIRKEQIDEPDVDADVRRDGR
jgi:uncharacterized protein (TIGR02271 family)